jgi:hypothetical protein
MMKFFILMTVFLLTAAGPARALTMEEGSSETTKTIMDYIEDYVDIPEGAVDWKTFGTTKEVMVKTKTEDGYDWEYYKPEFQEDLRKLDGQKIIVKGFMFPLDSTEAQKLFLFGPFPVSCPFQYHVGPSLVLEVHADDHPVTFNYDPVVLEGTLQLVNEDPENNTFYRLINARQR